MIKEQIIPLILCFEFKKKILEDVHKKQACFSFDKKVFTTAEDSCYWAFV